jgi:hypothetical protein
MEKLKTAELFERVAANLSQDTLPVIELPRTLDTPKKIFLHFEIARELKRLARPFVAVLTDRDELEFDHVHESEIETLAMDCDWELWRFDPRKCDDGKVVFEQSRIVPEE